MPTTIRRIGRLAIASGIVGILATVVLIAFYSLEAPQAVAAGAKTSRLGAVNDAMGGVEYLLLAPVAAMFLPARETLYRLPPLRGGGGPGLVGLACDAFVFL